MEELNIVYKNGRGRMWIDLDGFFPCPKKNLKMVLSTIDLDYQHRDELREKLKVYFQNKIVEHENGKKESAKLHLDFRQKEADTKQIVATGKHPNGVPLSEDEMKAEKENLRAYKTAARNQLSFYKQHEKAQKQFSDYLKLL